MGTQIVASCPSPSHIFGASLFKQLMIINKAGGAATT